ncbi:MAG: hypothetical protein ABFD12_07710 [Syntrophorhabdus sp.]
MSVKTKGILIILIGISIPLFALPFVSGFDMSKGFMDNFYNTGIRITKEQSPSSPAGEKKVFNPAKPFESAKNMRIEKLPYRLFFAPAVLLIYIGIVVIDRAKSKHTNQKLPKSSESA